MKKTLHGKRSLRASLKNNRSGRDKRRMKKFNRGLIALRVMIKNIEILFPLKFWGFRRAVENVNLGFIELGKYLKREQERIHNELSKTKSPS